MYELRSHRPHRYLLVVEKDGSGERMGRWSEGRDWISKLTVAVRLRIRSCRVDEERPLEYSQWYDKQYAPLKKYPLGHVPVFGIACFARSLEARQ
jgi:hypothetical protein